MAGFRVSFCVMCYFMWRRLKIMNLERLYTSIWAKPSRCHWPRKKNYKKSTNFNFCCSSTLSYIVLQSWSCNWVWLTIHRDSPFQVLFAKISGSALFSNFFWRGASRCHRIGRWVAIVFASFGIHGWWPKIDANRAVAWKHLAESGNTIFWMSVESVPIWFCLKIGYISQTTMVSRHFTD